MRTPRLPCSTAIRDVGNSAVQAATSGYRGTVTDHAATIPVLAGEAAEAVAHRGGHVQIIAAAGSGKTEVVSQRVASLLADGEAPSSIVAFTFTEKAASELKERIRQRVTAALGEDASDRLGQLFVGTIHAYCFRLLQTYIPLYETYTPLDENQLANLRSREANRLDIKQLDDRGRKFGGNQAFLEEQGPFAGLAREPRSPLHRIRAVFREQCNAFDVVRHREHTGDVTRDCGSLRPAAVNGRKWPLTCNDADFRRCWRQGPVAGLCESKRAQTAPCCQQAPTIANARKDRSVRDSRPRVAASTPEGHEALHTLPRRARCGHPAPARLPTRRVDRVPPIAIRPPRRPC